MAKPITPDDDPIVSKSLTPHYLIATVALLASLFWALWDETYGQRPWKRYQTEFKSRYGAFLTTDLKPKSAESEKEIKNGDEYKKLDGALKKLAEEVAPREKELNDKLKAVNAKTAAVQAKYTDARAYVGAKTYDAETTSSAASRARKLRDLEEYKKKPRYDVEIPGEGRRRLSFDELEQLYLRLRDEKAALTVQLGDIDKPVKDARDKRDTYLTDHLTSLTEDQIRGLQKKYVEWEPEIVQTNVAEANIVDRCESCHMGAREPVTLTRASLTARRGAKPDDYSRAFVSHPDPDLLQIHDPEKFGCSPCHGGNGRATTSVEKAHGHYEHWLWPLYAKDNVESGCQSCHAADMVLSRGPELAAVLDTGKDLFRLRGCMGCHRYEGYDKEPEELLSIRQQLKQLEGQKKESLKTAELRRHEADVAPSNEEAQRLNQEAEDLKLETTAIDDRVEQIDLRSRSVLRDMKKVGPNLKDIRAKLKRNWIPAWLHKPTDFRPTTKMPNFRLTEDQIKSIAAYLWQTALKDPLPAQKPGSGARGKELFETRGCMGCHSIGEGAEMQGGSFAANLTRIGEKASYDYLVRWIHNPRQRIRPYCPYEHRDIGPEDYARKGLPYVFDFAHSTCPNDGHELQVQQMTVMPILRLTPEDATDIATYLMTQKKKEPGSYPDASFMEDASLKEVGRGWIRHYGCAGCHEISGFEDEGRIGTELTVEGSKPIERLDFALLTHPAESGSDEPITDPEMRTRVPNPVHKGVPWYDHKGFFEHKLAMPNIYDLGKVKGPTEKLKMPDPHLTKDQVRALTTFLLGSQETPLPESYIYKPGDTRHDVQEGWWIVKKYNCMGCHQFLPGQQTNIEQIPRYQDPDWKEQRPPKLLDEGARVDPAWLARFLANPPLNTVDTNRNGVRTYLKIRMPTFNFSENEVRALVRFFQAYARQPLPYIAPPQELLTAKEIEMGRSLFASQGAPCLKCHATGNPQHDKTATAPNFLLARDRLKPGWTERWIIDPQSIAPGTSMPSNLFRREGEHWVFNGPVPPSFQGYDKDHTKLLVRYIFQLTPEEQRRVSGASGAAQRTSHKAVPGVRASTHSGSGL